MSTGTQVFEFLAREDVDGHQMDFGVTVFAGLGGAHFNDLAGAALDDDMAVLAEGRALHGEGRRCAGIGGIELHLMLKTGNVNDVPTQRLALLGEAVGSGVPMGGELTSSAMIVDYKRK